MKTKFIRHGKLTSRVTNTVRSVSSLVESSTSNTEDEIQRSLIELGKN